jgi:putative membrane protein
VAAVVLSVVSIALVFAAALGVVPSDLLPRSATLVAVAPHVNAVVSVVAVVTILVGWRAIRRGNVRRHRTAMIVAFGLFLAFLVLYFYKVILAGPKEFAGPDAVFTYVYLPILAVHVLLAMATLPLLYYVLLVAATRPVSAIPETPHPRVGRLAATMWIVSFVLGLVVYAMAYLAFG